MTNIPVLMHVADFAGGPFAVSVEDGQRLNESIAPLLAANTPVALSFAMIETLSGAFLAASVGPFCADYSEAELAGLLTVRDISSRNQEMVQLSLVNAWKYYANRVAYDAAWAEKWAMSRLSRLSR